MSFNEDLRLTNENYKTLLQELGLSADENIGTMATSVQPILKNNVTRKRNLKKINEKNRKAQNQRKSDLRQLKSFMKQGFEQTFTILANKIRQSQEMTSINITVSYLDLMGSMKKLNMDMVVLEGNQYNNARVLQYRILFTHKLILALRKQVFKWIQELSSANHQRQEQLLEAIKITNENAVKIAGKISGQIAQTQKNLSDIINTLAQSLVTLQGDINAQFGSMKQYIEQQSNATRAEIRSHMSQLDTRVNEVLRLIDSIRVTMNPPARPFV